MSKRTLTWHDRMAWHDEVSSLIMIDDFFVLESLNEFIDFFRNVRRRCCVTLTQSQFCCDIRFAFRFDSISMINDSDSLLALDCWKDILAYVNTGFIVFICSSIVDIIDICFDAESDPKKRMARHSVAGNTTMFRCLSLINNRIVSLLVGIKPNYAAAQRVLERGLVNFIIIIFQNINRLYIYIYI